MFPALRPENLFAREDSVLKSGNLRWLIILRGVPGVGKNTVRDSLIKQLGSDKACDLNMDVIEPKQIEKNIKAALNYDNVIAHLYYGNQNTLDPDRWVSRFKDAGYQIVSIRLEISREAGCKRCLSRPGEWMTEQEYYWAWDSFQRSLFIDFAKRADVNEVSVDAEKHPQDSIADQILSEIMKRNKNDAS